MSPQSFYYCLDAPVDLQNPQSWNDINVVAGVVKQYFRELVEPVLPFDLYETLMTAVRTFLSVRSRAQCSSGP